MLTSYLPAFAGGFLIGLACVLMLLLLGRIAGISGVLWQCLTNTSTKTPSGLTNILFVAGLIIGPILVHHVLGQPMPASTQQPLWLIIVAGLLVGFGTRLGSGCTSGHGICGIARFSKRSVLATACFMASGVITASLIHGVLLP